jgi:hypothetical protein
MYGQFYIWNWPKRYFRFFARFQSAPPDGTWVKIQLRSPAGMLAETAAVRLSTRLMQDLGVMLIPPYQLAEMNYVELRFYAMKAGGGTLNLDCLMLMGQDNYVELGRDDTATITTNYDIVEQWGERKSYIREYVTGEVVEEWAFFNKSFGDGIWLVPGINQRLYFLMYLNNTAPITTSMLVQCWYKPRKRAL